VKELEGQLKARSEETATLKESLRNATRDNSSSSSPKDKGASKEEVESLKSRIQKLNRELEEGE